MDGQQGNILSVAQEAGVRDLPTKVRGKFALALKFEREGDSVKAEQYLEQAIAEEKLLGMKPGVPLP